MFCTYIYNCHIFVFYQQLQQPRFASCKKLLQSQFCLLLTTTMVTGLPRINNYYCHIFTSYQQLLLPHFYYLSTSTTGILLPPLPPNLMPVHFHRSLTTMYTFLISDTNYIRQFPLSDYQSLLPISPSTSVTFVLSFSLLPPVTKLQLTNNICRCHPFLHGI